MLSVHYFLFPIYDNFLNRTQVKQYIKAPKTSLLRLAHIFVRYDSDRALTIISIDSSQDDTDYGSGWSGIRYSLPADLTTTIRY